MSEMHREIGEAVSHSVEGTAFFGSIMAGLLLGFLADKWLGTDPAFIVVGIIAGSVTGFWRMWWYATAEDRDGR